MGVMAGLLGKQYLHYGPVALPPVPSPASYLAARTSCTASCESTLTLPLYHLHPCHVWPPTPPSQLILSRSRSY
jgi:hypothetical protein